MLDHRNSQQVRQLHQRLDRGRGLPEVARQDHRVGGAHENFRRLLKVSHGRLVLAGRLEHVRRHPGGLHGLVQPFPGQRQVHRAPGFRHGDLEGPGHDGAELLVGAVLEIPLDELAYDGALVTGLLAPVDVPALAPRHLALGHRGPSRHEQHGHLARLGVHEPAEAVGGAGQSVHQHHLRLARGAVVAVGHGHRRLLVGHHDDLRALGLATVHLGQGLEDRAVVRPGVGENVVHIRIGIDLRQKGFGSVGHGHVFEMRSRHIGGLHGLGVVVRLVYSPTRVV